MKNRRKRRKRLKRLKKGISKMVLKNRGLLSRKDLKMWLDGKELVGELLNERKSFLPRLLRKGLKLITSILTIIIGNKSNL